MPQTLDVSGLDRKLGQLQSLKNLDATDLMLTWMRVIDQDNRRGILQGLDKDGVPMVPVKYRPTGPLATRTAHKEREALRKRRVPSARARKGEFKGLAADLFGNLTHAEYELLAGPPLAPRAQFSRVITNFKTTWGGPGHGSTYWFAAGGWDEVVDIQGRPFLKYHFHSVPSKLPRRDLRGVRPDGMAKANDALANWSRLKVRETFSGTAPKAGEFVKL